MASSNKPASTTSRSRRQSSNTSLTTTLPVGRWPQASVCSNCRALGKLHRPMDVCPIRLRDELDFWRIPISLIAPCCRFPETKKHGLAALGDQVSHDGNRHDYLAQPCRETILAVRRCSSKRSGWERSATERGTFSRTRRRVSVRRSGPSSRRSSCFCRLPVCRSNHHRLSK